MKTTFVLFVGLVMFATSSFGQSVGPMVSTAEPDLTGSGPQKANIRSAAVGSGGHITITSLLFAGPASPNLGTVMDAAISDATTGTLTGVALFTSPSQYMLCNGRLVWQNLVTSDGAPMWSGVLNPSVPFNFERGGPVIWIVADYTGTSVALSDLAVTAKSNDPDNKFGGTMTFDGADYTPRAPLFSNDGGIITSGSGTKTGKRVLVLIGIPTFIGCDTQRLINQARDWVNAHDPVIEVSVMVRGDSSTRAVTRVSLNSLPLASMPRLTITRNTDSMTANILVDGDVSGLYSIQFSPGSKGPWTELRTVNGGDIVKVPTTEPTGFYKAVRQ